jgi:hypothetical protein
MGDVADILGMGKSTASSSTGEDAAKILGLTKPKQKAKLIEKPKGMSREVFALLGKDVIAPAIPGGQGLVLKSKWKNSLKGKWIWAPIQPFSARR